MGSGFFHALASPTFSPAEHQHRSHRVTLFGDHRETVSDLLKRADLAVYQAKTAGRNRVRFFDQKMQAAVSARNELEADLRRAVREGQLIIHYQPQVDGDGRLTGAEALVRRQL